MPRLKKADELDVQIGAAIKARRMGLGWSQAELAGRIDVTYQQVQKYEAGTNRVSAAVLAKISSALGCELAALVPSGERVDAPSDLQALYSAASELPPEKLRILLDVALTFRQALSSKAAPRAGYNRAK